MATLEIDERSANRTNIEALDETKDDDIVHADPELTKTDIVVQDAEIKGQKLSGYEDLTFWQTVKHFKMATLYCVIPSIAAAADGYQTGINGSIIAQQGFIAQFGTKFNAKGVKILDPKVVIAISTIQAVGSMCGLLSLPFFAARFGRKKAFLLIWVLLALSVMFESIAKRWEIWFVAKLLSGLGIGSIQFNTPTYIAECSPVKIRGVLLFTYDIWFSVGGLIATIALQVMNVHKPTDWQIPVYTQWGLIGIMAVIYVAIPESPFWCANGGREEQGRAALRRFHRGVQDFNEDRQWEVMVLTVNHERQVAEINGGGKWVDIFKGVDGFRTLACAWTIVAAQLLGLPLINTYAAYFFSQLNLTDPFLLTAITKAPQIVVGIICAFLVDSVGRRNLCCGFLTLMWFCCLGMAVTGCVPVTHSMTIALVFLASLFMCAVTAATSIGYGLMGELPAQRHRAHTAGFSAGSAGIFNITNIAIAPYMLSTTSWNWGGKSFFLYTGLGFVAAFGSWFIIPEPAGRTQAELDEMFEAKVKPWRFRKYKTATQMAVEAQHRAQG